VWKALEAWRSGGRLRGSPGRDSVMEEGQRARGALLMLRGMDRANARKSAVMDMVSMERLGSLKLSRLCYECRCASIGI
jgi:hypothetical protein